MPREIIMDNEYATIEYLPDEGVVYQTAHQSIAGQPFREITTTVYEYFRDHDVTKYLCDDRLRGPLPEEDNAWGAEWSNLMLSAGWRYWAIVVPVEIVNAGTLTEGIQDVYEKGGRVMVFSEVEKAMEWLAQF